MSEMHQALLARGISVAQRSVTYLMQRDARTGDLTHHGSGADQGTLTAARTRDPGPRWGASRMWATKCSGWYVTATRREILLARPLLSRTQGDLTALLKEVKQLLKELEVPVTGVISDREETRGSAVAFVFPGVPHQRCQFHSLKDATKPLYEANQHAKTQLKKQLRGV